MLNDQFSYPSGAASLFASHARSAPTPQTGEPVVFCPRCEGKAQLIDNERGLFECCGCGKVFTREAAREAR